MKRILAPILLLSLGTLHALAGETVIKDLEGMDCHVYTPETMTPGKRYQLVVGVHGVGGNGKGACGMAGWAKRGDVIVIGPTFVTKGERPYQNGDGIHAKKLIALAETLGKSHQLNEKMFLHGFSGGAQFVHRFAMLHPNHVCGASAHSAGSWATDGYGEMSSSAKKVFFAISCGEKDTAKSFPQAPFNRLEWYGRFRDALEAKKFTHIAASWPDVGHSHSPGIIDFAKQCFQLSTGLPGENATTTVAISDQWSNLPKAPTPLPATRPASAQPAIDEATLDNVARAAFAKADAEQVPREQLVNFMKRYPPVLWKEKPGAENLLRQCEQAATEWRDAAKARGMWSDAVKEEFLRFSEGIAIDTENLSP